MKNIITHIKECLSGVYETRELECVIEALSLELLGISHTDFWLKESVELSEFQKVSLDKALERLCKHEPLQYVLGSAPLCGMSFQVDSRVLVPRPETGGLIEWIAADVTVLEPEFRILDVGTGSGCLAINLKRLFPMAHVAGFDVMPDALEVARGNAARLGQEVEFAEIDILSAKPSHGMFDLLVSNPPYITECEKASMESTVLDYEPYVALFVPDSDPLLLYRAVAEYALLALSPRGKMFFEINPLFTHELEGMFCGYGFSKVEFREDIFGKVRFCKVSRV